MANGEPLLKEFLSRIESVNILDLGSRPTPNNPPIYKGMLDLNLCELIAVDVYKGSHEAEKHPTQYLEHYIGDGTLRTFYECELKSKSSLFEPNFDCTDLFQTFSFGAEIQSQNTVQTKQLDELGYAGLVDWLCMDIQGSELMALENGKKTLKNITVVHSEVEFVEQYKGQPLFGDIDCELRSQGFMFHSFSGYASKAWRPMIIENDISRGKNQWLWADAIYIKHPELWGDIDVNNLLKMALIMNFAYESWDLSYSLFSKVDQRLGSDFSLLHMDYLMERDK